MSGPWRIKLSCGHVYRLAPASTPDLKYPLICAECHAMSSIVLAERVES